MMNEYYGQPYRFSGRNRRDSDRGDRTPYRRPMGRGSVPAYPYGNQSIGRSGCGCGSQRNQPCNERRCASERNQPGSYNRGSDHNSAYEQRKAIPVGQNAGCDCGEHGGASTACKKLMEQIRAVDFALYEVILYLDVYPNSCDALETYHKLKTQKEALHKEYEAACGPITAFGNQSGTSWDWISSPFPWEFGAE